MEKVSIIKNFYYVTSFHIVFDNQMRIDYLSINSFYLLFFLYCEFFMPLDCNQSGKWTMINIISIIIIKYNETYRFDNFSVRIGLFMEHNWINFKNNSKDNYLKIRCTRFEDFFHADIQFIQIPFELFGSLALPDERGRAESRGNSEPLFHRNLANEILFQLPRFKG